MIVDLKVAAARKRAVDAGVADQRCQQMVQESDAGPDVGGAGSVEVDGDRDLGFIGGVPVRGGAALNISGRRERTD
jgi:hypothetical protein